MWNAGVNDDTINGKRRYQLTEHGDNNAVRFENNSSLRPIPAVRVFPFYSSVGGLNGISVRHRSHGCCVVAIICGCVAVNTRKLSIVSCSYSSA